MSAGTPAEGLAPEVERAFVDLLCDDAELVDREFAAIIAANGLEGDPPVPARPGRVRGERRPMTSGRWGGAAARLVAPAHLADRRLPGRQRSPPRLST